jgi:hypothetical protein
MNASKRIQEAIKEGNYSNINIKRVTAQSKAQQLQNELNSAIRRVQELNTERQQAQFDADCLQAKFDDLVAINRKKRENSTELKL